jgi:hypothetical protein
VGRFGFCSFSLIWISLCHGKESDPATFARYPVDAGSTVYLSNGKHQNNVRGFIHPFFDCSTLKNKLGIDMRYA